MSGVNKRDTQYNHYVEHTSLEPSPHVPAVSVKLPAGEKEVRARPRHPASG